MMESQKLIETLGWTAAQGNQFLIDNYQKKGRQNLTDAEFVDFVNKLQSQQPYDEEVGYWPEDEVPY